MKKREDEDAHANGAVSSTWILNSGGKKAYDDLEITTLYIRQCVAGSAEELNRLPTRGLV